MFRSVTEFRENSVKLLYVMCQVNLANENMDFPELKCLLYVKLIWVENEHYLKGKALIKSWQSNILNVTLLVISGYYSAFYHYSEIWETTHKWDQTHLIVDLGVQWHFLCKLCEGNGRWWIAVMGVSRHKCLELDSEMRGVSKFTLFPYFNSY